MKIKSLFEYDIVLIYCILNNILIKSKTFKFGMYKAYIETFD